MVIFLLGLLYLSDSGGGGGGGGGDLEKRGHPTLAMQPRIVYDPNCN